MNMDINKKSNPMYGKEFLIYSFDAINLMHQRIEISYHSISINLLYNKTAMMN